MTLIQAQIAHLQKLTALKDSVKNIFIDPIVAYFDELQSVDTSSIERTSRSGKGTLLLRPDIIRQEDSSLPDALLACSPQRVIAHQISLSSIMRTDA